MIGSFAQAISASIAFSRVSSCFSAALIAATAGSGPMAAAVAQQAVVVSGEMPWNSATDISIGMKLIRRLVASISFASPSEREYLAEIAVGATLISSAQNSSGKP